MKNTALTNTHIALGAKMVEFAGYNMPVSYSGINDEHATVRNNVGMFDVSHMGEFLVKGPGALDLIQYVTSNDASRLEIGKAQYSCLPNGQGGIVDDLLVYKLAEQEYMLVVNASNMEKDWSWINSHNSFNAELENIADDITLLAVQGPKAMDTLQKLTSVNLGDIPYYAFVQGMLAGVPDVIISATGYTGAGGFELYFPNQYAEKVWNAVMEAGAEFGIKAIGLGARDTLRLEKGYCLYGNDIDDTTSPIEAGLGWITKLNKGEFIDSALLREQKETGTTRRLVGFNMVDRGIPRHDYIIVDAEGNPIGKVTSGTQSPTLGQAIGLGYVNDPYNVTGSEIYIQVRNKNLKAEVVKLPFL